MNAGFTKASTLKSLLGSLSLCLSSTHLAVAAIANQATGEPPVPTAGAGSPAPMTDIHDIKPAIAFGSHWPWWVWLLIILALAALAAGVWWLRRRNLTSQGARTIPSLPPEVEAFQQLDALTADGCADPKRFYFSLSAVLRRYVERRFDFPAAEMTTEELLPQIRRLSVEETLAQAFRRFCLSSDPIKFADAAADQDRMHQDIAFARQFVTQTTAAVEPATPAESHKPAVIALENNP